MNNHLIFAKNWLLKLLDASAFLRASKWLISSARSFISFDTPFVITIIHTHPITSIHTEADISIINVLKALSSTFPIMYFLGIIKTPTCKIHHFISILFQMAHIYNYTYIYIISYHRKSLKVQIKRINIIELVS